MRSRAASLDRRAVPAALDRLVAGQHRGPIAEDVAPPRADGVELARRDVEVARPGLAGDQLDPFVQQGAVVVVDLVRRRRCRPCRGRRSRAGGCPRAAARRAVGRPGRSAQLSPPRVGSAAVHVRDQIELGAVAVDQAAAGRGRRSRPAAAVSATVNAATYSPPRRATRVRPLSRNIGADTTVALTPARSARSNTVACGWVCSGSRSAVRSRPDSAPRQVSQLTGSLRPAARVV